MDAKVVRIALTSIPRLEIRYFNIEQVEESYRVCVMPVHFTTLQQ